MRLDFEFGNSGGGMDSILWTDNKNAVLIAPCFDGKYFDWVVNSKTPILPENVKEQVLHQITALGFNPNNAAYYDYQNLKFLPKPLSRNGKSSLGSFNLDRKVLYSSASVSNQTINESMQSLTSSQSARMPQLRKPSSEIEVVSNEAEKTPLELNTNSEAEVVFESKEVLEGGEIEEEQTILPLDLDFGLGSTSLEEEGTETTSTGSVDGTTAESVTEVSNTIEENVIIPLPKTASRFQKRKSQRQNTFRQTPHQVVATGILIY
jgi:hypothetical protein